MQNEQEQIKVNPFIGPSPFGRNIEDQVRFFGRNQETEEIVTLIFSHQLTLVYAQSGAGKTSIINAQVIPELEKYGYQVLPVSRVGISTFSDVNVSESSSDGMSKSNHYVFNALCSMKSDIINPKLLSNKSLSDFLDEFFPAKVGIDGKPLPQVIIFDQLEELFNLFPKRWREEQIGFFKQVTEALSKNQHLRIVLVIREDYLAQLDPFSRLLPEKLRPRFRLERLRKEAAISSIKGPLERADYSFDIKEIERLVQDLLKMRVETITGKSIELDGEFVEPIQLQVVCRRWWRERFSSKEIITDPDYLSNLADVDGALEDFYESAILDATKQTGIDEDTIRNWFDEKLITSSGTRSSVHRDRSTGTTGGIPNNVIDILENRYLIRKEERAGAQWYELTHDRLIGPIKDSNGQRRSEVEKEESRFTLRKFLHKRFYSPLKKNRKSIIIGTVLFITIFVVVPAIFVQEIGPNLSLIITDIGKFPTMMHYSPKNNILYTSNINDGTISSIAINGTENGTTHDVLKNIKVGNTPMGIDSNPDIDRLYVANYKNDQISVVGIKSYLNTEIEKINVGDKPVGVAVNPETNAVYVTNAGSNSISVIDGKTNLVDKTFTVGKVPVGVEINPKSNTIYVANFNNDSVSIVDGSVNEVIANLPVGSGPIDLATDPITNRTYVANYLDDSVTIIEGTTNRSSVLETVKSKDMNRPFDIVISPFTDQIFISNSESNQISVLDGETNGMLDPVSTEESSFGLAIDNEDKTLFAAQPFANQVEKVQVGVRPYIQLNWRPEVIESYYENNTVYVANAESEIISAYDIRTKKILDIIDLKNLTLHPDNMAINPNGKLLYAYGSGVLAAINMTSNKVVMNTSIPTALSAYDRETDIVVNPNTNLIYLAQNGTDEVFVYNDIMTRERDNLQANDTTQQMHSMDNQINEPKDNGWYSINVNGNRRNSTTIMVSDLAVDPKTNLAYVATVGDDGYSVISDNKSDWKPLNFAPEDIDVNPNTNKIYIAYPDFVSIIDGNTSKVIKNIGLNTSLTTADIYIDNNTNRVYLASPEPYEMQALEVIDGTDNTLLGEIPLLRNVNDLSFSPDGSQILMSIPELNIIAPIMESEVKPRPVKQPLEDTLDFKSEFRN